MDARSNWVFRLAPLVLFWLAVAVQVYYGRRTRQGDRPYAFNREAAKREGWRRLGVHSVALVLMVLWVTVYAARPEWLRWSALALRAEVRWLGIAIGFVALLGLIIVHRALGRFWSWDLRIQQDHKLVTEGVYARVRHPMYTVLMAHTVGLAVVSSSWLFMLLCAARIAGLYLRIRREEAMLIEKFGDEYRAYMRRAGRLLPRL